MHKTCTDDEETNQRLNLTSIYEFSKINLTTNLSLNIKKNDLWLYFGDLNDTISIE